MKDTAHRAVAIVGLGSILPDAPDAKTFWKNIKSGRYSVSDVDSNRWDPELYFDPDPKVPDKTYSKIGGWVRHWEWKPFDWKLPIPPKVANAMDDAQRWAINITRSVLEDYGYPDRPLDKDRTAVILGNAMAGEKHYLTALRVSFPEFARELEQAESFRELPKEVRERIIAQTREGMNRLVPDITEDSMPGELANVIAGRIANVFNFHGPNYVVDAACASAMAAITSAVEGLIDQDYDAVITGGIDRNMGASTFVKFCKIGALSATGTRPYGDGADGFVMGEGAALFLMKRLSDAERDGDHIYAVLRGIGGSSDGKGKGITAPNPVGQKLAIQRAWDNAGLSPATASFIEGHGTSTKVGDVVEVESLTEVFTNAGAEPHSVALGSVKSNFGHLKGAAGAAGILKACLALDEKVIPPSLHCAESNPNIDFSRSPFYVNGDLRQWKEPPCGVRRAGVSAFGFGGTNFHAVFEEYIPGRLNGDGRIQRAVPRQPGFTSGPSMAASAKAPPAGALVLGADGTSGLASRLHALRADLDSASELAGKAPLTRDLNEAERIAIDFRDRNDLGRKIDLTLRAFETDDAGMWKALNAQGVYHGSGSRQKIAFLFPGQGSQYINMLNWLRASEPVVRETFDQADRVMEPILGTPLSDYIFAEDLNEEQLKKAAGELMQTEITQPALIATDIALSRLLAAHGVTPDMVMGHSLGEYGALTQAGAIGFADALEAVAARGHEMSKVSMDDNGRMAAVFAPLTDVQRIISKIQGYAVIANINSYQQSVIGGETAAIEEAIEQFTAEGIQAVPLPVSHAFHTKIVAPASEPLRRVLSRMHLRAPTLPVISNVSGDFYPVGEHPVDTMLDLLARQIASPVQFIKGLETLYDAGARVFVEVGPKKALKGLVDGVLGDRKDVTSLFTNHPKLGDQVSLNQALCGLYANGHGAGRPDPLTETVVTKREAQKKTQTEIPRPPSPITPSTVEESAPVALGSRADQLEALFTDFIRKGSELIAGQPAAAPTRTERVFISGVSLGLPGTRKLFDDENIGKILHGEQFIDVIPRRYRQAMANKHIKRLVKPEHGDPVFTDIDDTRDVIKLAGRAGAFDVVSEFGVKKERAVAFDSTTAMAVAAGIDALRDAGIPLVLSYKTTTTGGKLPDRWRLPDEMRDDTGIVFASAFPGGDALSEQLEEFYTEKAHLEQLAGLQSLREWLSHQGETQSAGIAEIDRRIDELKNLIEREDYHFDRRFLFRVLSMGHSQFAEEIGARGPNTQINGACASTTHAISLAEDWIREGRCSRVIVVSADNVTSDHLIEWIGSGFLASGAAATDENVEDAATPFDRRRHGMIMGMGAAALVVESEDSMRSRGLLPICEILGSVIVNSAFHGTRLDVEHISGVMERLVSEVEREHGVSRQEMAPRMLFMSHETYTPARGGSASAEINALRHVFGERADEVVITNTKGFTGHAMGAGIEDAVAVKALETGIVPPVPNFREVDPELGNLNLSTGGTYPVRYAMRLAAGFGSQLGMNITRSVPSPDGRRRNPDQLGFQYRIADQEAWQGWLSRISGHETAEVEVVSRRLRIRDQGPPRHRATGSANEITVPAPASVTPPPPTPAEPAVRPQQVAAEAAPTPAPASVPSGDGVEERVIQLVAEKTDYPPDMLDLDLDLEADLGVDTVKQAEVFAEIREAYGIPRDENLQLREFPTLAHVVQFVRDRAPDLPKTEALLEAGRIAAEAAPSAAPAAPQAGDEANEGVRQKVLEIVSSMTGYPPDMLDFELDLEADLGIDTVKQAEIFAALRESYGIPRDETLQLKDFPTLEHAIGFVRDRLPAETPVAEPASPPAAEVREPVKSADFPGATLEAADRVPRRVPFATWRPPIDMCKTTGVPLDASQRVLVLSDRGGVAKALVRRLEKRGVEVLTLEPGTDDTELENLIQSWAEIGPIAGVYWLPALDAHETIGAMDHDAWREAVRIRVKSLHAAMQVLCGQPAGDDCFLVAATRMGGKHGYDEAGALNPLGGAVAGFVKAYKRERPAALCKAVDFAESRKTAVLSDRIIEETLRDPGVVEVGFSHGQRWTIGLREIPCDGTPSGLELNDETVYLVTGAAGSIVSAIVTDLVQSSGGTFHLLDLVPEPARDDPDIAQFADNREAMKRIIFDRIKETGKRATPAAVEKELARLERAHAALTAISAIEASGGTAHYHAVDLTDDEAVRTVVQQVREASGRVDVLMHAAGLEISRFLQDKPREEFDLVFDVKCDGWQSLLGSLRDTPLKAAVVFSSVAGRFGNSGQTDYSAANDLLCKSISALRSERPETLGIAIDWTAWDEIGMATRGSIPTMMKAAGIDMLAPETGIPTVRRELTMGPAVGEVVVAGSLGMLNTEWDETGGLDPESVTNLSGGPMIGRVTAMGIFEGLTVETELNPKEQAFLYDHKIDGTPVLPGVMGMEAFAELSTLLLPEWRIECIEDVQFLEPFKFYRNEPRKLKLTAQFSEQAGEMVARCTLIGERKLKKLHDPVVSTAFTASVRLSRQQPVALRGEKPSPAAGPSIASDDVYKVYFHGPAYQVLDSAWVNGGNAVTGRLADSLPANHKPAEQPTKMAPRLIELCFQTAGMYELGVEDRFGLPSRVRRVQKLKEVKPDDMPFYTIVRHSEDGRGFDAEVVDQSGEVYMRLTDYRTAEVPGAAGAMATDAIKSVF